MGCANIIRLWSAGLVQAEPVDLASGEVMVLAPAINDQGSLQIGDSTHAMDLKWYGDTATSIVTFDAGLNQLTLAGVSISSNAAINTSGTVTLTGALNTSGTVTATGAVVPSSNGSIDQKIVVQNTNTTMNATHWGSLVLNKAAGDRVYTLPTPAAALSGKWFEFVSSAAQNTTFTAQTANTLLALNTLAANSVALSTANEIIGASCRWVCDGAQWVFLPFAGTATVTD